MDVLATKKVLKKLGIHIENRDHSQGKVQVTGRGFYFEPSVKQNEILELDCENAGTLMRLMAGTLSGQKFMSRLVGDDSLMGRPMDRVAEPLQTLGANIQLTENKAPIVITPSDLCGGKLYLESPSAQVKSAVMFASLYAQNSLTLELKHLTRDHTEKLFPFFGIPIEILNSTIQLYPQPKIKPVHYKIPCDPSAAAFWIVASLISGQKIELKDICLNPTRLGTIRTLKKLGIEIDLNIEKEIGSKNPERVGSLVVHPQNFDGFEILEKQLPSLIDEIPVLTILATQARSESVIHNAKELRFKETDRIVTVQKMFESLGLRMSVEGDTLRIPGQQVIQGGVVEAFGDHRIAMSAAIASFAAKGEIEIRGWETASISDSYFWENFK
jgi:3-phosphoshikimate 1-carboxyvinyltransferase